MPPSHDVPARGRGRLLLLRGRVIVSQRGLLAGPSKQPTPPPRVALISPAAPRLAPLLSFPLLVPCRAEPCCARAARGATG